MAQGTLDMIVSPVGLFWGASLDQTTHPAEALVAQAEGHGQVPAESRGRLPVGDLGKWSIGEGPTMEVGEVPRVTKVTEASH